MFAPADMRVHRDRRLPAHIEFMASGSRWTWGDRITLLEIGAFSEIGREITFEIVVVELF